MINYMNKDIISNLEPEKARNLVGKEVYYSNCSKECLSNARRGRGGIGILKKVRDSSTPFIIENWEGSVLACSFIIPKDPKGKGPEYFPFFPFFDKEDFLHKCMRTDFSKLYENEHQLDKEGIWLKDLESSYYRIATIREGGVELEGHKGEYIRWEDLIIDYTFPDGSACGKS